ncbi:MAG: L,D-transpeptidase [Pseudomonadota bacterium]
MRISTVFGALAVIGAFALPASADISIKMLEPTLKADIDLTNQRMHISVNGEKIHEFKISSGRLGYTTPTGSYHPYRMHTMWRSRKYNNAPMPHAVFFKGGYAVHGTSSISRLGRPASHGCIRLHPKNAKKFFDLVLEHSRARTQVNLTGGWKYSKKQLAAAKRKKKPRRRTTWQRNTGRSDATRVVRRRQVSRSTRGFFRVFD